MDTDIYERLYIAIICERNGSYKEAVQCCEDILDVSKGDSDVCATVQYLLIEILVKKGFGKMSH